MRGACSGVLPCLNIAKLMLQQRVSSSGSLATSHPCNPASFPFGRATGQLPTTVFEFCYACTQYNVI